MNFVEISAILNIGRWIKDVPNWWRRRQIQNSSTDSLDPVKRLQSTKNSVNSLPVGILPQEFEFVDLEKIFVGFSDLTSIYSSFSVRYELKVRRVDEVEITIKFFHTKYWSTRKTFYISFDTSNSSGSFKGIYDFAEEYIQTDMIAFAYISYIKFKDDDKSWKIEEDSQKKLIEDTINRLESVIYDQTL